MMWPAIQPKTSKALAEMIAFATGWSLTVSIRSRRPEGYNVVEVEILIEKSGAILERGRQCMKAGNPCPPSLRCSSKMGTSWPRECLFLVYAAREGSFSRSARV